MRIVSLVAALALSLAACSTGRDAPDEPPVSVGIEVSSSAFADGTPLPERYTCDGENVSPPLRWGEPPAGTAEIAVVVDDLDAQGGSFVHWLVYGIEPEVREIPEGGPVPGAQGTNGFGDAAYGGPCPPPGDQAHRYQFSVLALAEPSGLEPGASADDFYAAIATASASGTIVAPYSRAG